MTGRGAACFTSFFRLLAMSLCRSKSSSRLGRYCRSKMKLRGPHENGEQSLCELDPPYLVNIQHPV